MPESSADADPPPDTGSEPTPEPSAAAKSEPTPKSSATAGSEVPSEFGSQTPTRFAADVEYRGRVEEHDYLVHVRHRLLDSTFTVVIDGVEHDPKAAAKAAKKAAPDQSAPVDGLRFRLEENFTVTYCSVRRPAEDGELSDAEVLAVRTAGLGGAGEVDVGHGLERWPLAPEDGSPSAVRDRKRLAHPTRYAALAALTTTLGFLLPLLGLGALFAGLLDPITDWIAARMRPLVDAIGRIVAPVRDWIADVLRPVREFFEALLSPVREFFATLLRPLVEAWNWAREKVLGWLPEIDLGIWIPEWVVDVAVPVIVVVVVFVATSGRLRRRREKLDAARAAATEEPAVQQPGGQKQAEPAAADGETGKSVEDPGSGSSPD